MNETPTKQKLDKYVKLGMLIKQNHPTLPLKIYGYSQFTNFERLWNNVTLQARGLVVDEKGRCVVRCLPKFFNHDEPKPYDRQMHFTPDTRVFDKLDGSLIQVVNDKEYGLIVTSKGSFNSDQSNWAKEIIKKKGYEFEAGITYVFELIHPENRIVLDYGGETSLKLLAAVDTRTGNEFEIFRSKNFNQFEKVVELKQSEMKSHLAKVGVEGVVIFLDGYRVKMKNEEYVRLHRVVTDFTPKRVWEMLKESDEVELVNMPEEFMDWYNSTKKELQDKFDSILEEVTNSYESNTLLSDKELGLSDVRYKNLVFNIRNGINIHQDIWKIIKPNQKIKNIK